MSENTAQIEDRDANIQQTVLHIINTKQDEMFAEFDRLHRRGIHDDDVVAALQHFGETDLLDAYAEWGDIDLREPEQRIPDTPVPDPGNNPSDLQMQQAYNPAVVSTVEQLALLRDGVILALKGGRAGQVRVDCGGAYLMFAGSDITERISEADDNGNVQIVDAAQRRELAPYLPAVALGVGNE